MKSPIVSIAWGICLLVTFALTAHAAGPTTPQEWFTAGQRAVEQAASLTRNTAPAKNVILFVGDGMGISTITASRIFEGQQRGDSGEENQLSFEQFPHVALSKTYSVNQQTPDSAPTMTAMVTGVKTNDRLISVDQFVKLGEPDGELIKQHSLKTVLEMAEEKGLSTGVVSTARITHATPAACYAHTSDRDWEGDTNLPAGATVPDIARQLIEFPFGNGLEVALGGGREHFLPLSLNDPEDAEKTGSRKDERNLTKEWLTKYPRSAFVWNTTGFTEVNPATTDHLLGLFERSHLEFGHDRPRDTGGEPSLSEMTAKAIAILRKNKKGFFLMVESGRIDHAHHAGNAYRALTDTIELAKAVRLAKDATNPRDTLIIVTADHSHVFSIAGYPKRGNPILGKVMEANKTELARDLLGLPYTTLSYANGPGYTGESHDAMRKETVPPGPKSFPHQPDRFSGITSGRPDLTNVDTTNPQYLQETIVPFAMETHGGEDVAIFATGPQAHLFHGVQEQNIIAHVMIKALRLASRK